MWLGLGRARCGGPVVVGEVFLGEGLVGEERDGGDGCELMSLQLEKKRS